MANLNGFATKKDINKLERKMNLRFEQVDKRFGWFRSEIKSDFELWRKDAFREFEHRWQQFIDPILKEIEKHREKEVLHFEQYNRQQILIEKIAKKVGVEVN